MKAKIIGLVTSAVALSFSGCSPSVSSLKKTIEDNPEIVFGAIEKHPDKFLEVVNKAAREAQGKAREKEEAEEGKRMEEEFKNPKTPSVAENMAILGNKSAPITIIEYSDFECPYCSRAHGTVRQVLDQYKDKVRVIYKHLPLEFHKNAMPAAKYFEALVLQSPEKAYKWHDKIFDNRDKLVSGGEKFMDQVAKEVGANVAKVKKDLDSKAVTDRIASDVEEAKKFGFTGTPGFLINGVSLKGAYPFEDFKKIIDRQLSKN